MAKLEILVNDQVEKTMILESNQSRVQDFVIVDLKDVDTVKIALQMSDLDYTECSDGLKFDESDSTIVFHPPRD